MKANLAREKFLKRLHLLLGFAMMFTALLLPAAAAGQISLVQINTNPNSFVYTNSVDVPFTAAQTAGNLNVVVVGWSDTSNTIASVVDSTGNTYALAAGPVSTPLPASSQPGVSQAIYYAKNIAAGANTVTVNFNQNTAVQSIRIAEYSGLDLTNPLDTSAGSSGTATTADSGTVTTNSANDLIFGAGTITTSFTGNGPGFTTQLLNGFGDIVEDAKVTTTSGYASTAVLTTGTWVMQMAAFRQAGQTPPTFLAPTITSLSVASSPEAGAAPLTITGTNFEPGAAVLFSNAGSHTAGGVNCAVASTTGITCLTPAFPVGAAGITVTNVDGQTSGSFAFNFTASTPFATAVSPSIIPNTGSTNGGAAVNISGSDFAAGAKVTIGGVTADKVLVANVNNVQANLPAGSAGVATVVVTNPSSTAGTLPGGFTYTPAPTISFVQANSAQPASPATTATIAYTLAQTAGDLNVIIIGWADATATVQSVTDSAANTYTLAFSPTVGTGLSQAIYYAKNINAAASNTVTVTFNVAAQSPDVRILEYSGIDPVLALDSGGGKGGTGTTLSSGPITTTNVVDLIVAAGIAASAITGAGQSFTTVAVTPSASVEHLIGQQAGVISATASQASNANWVMQAVAFEQAGTVPDFGVSVTPPTTATVASGSPATYIISVSAVNGFTSAVTLTCTAGLPPSASCAFVPPSVTLAGTPVTSTLTLTTSPSTPAATSTVTVTGTSGLLSHNTMVGLTVTPGPDFTIAAAALSPASVAAGGSSTSTITIAPTNGFTGAVSLTCSAISPAGTRAPTCSFNPSSVAGGSGTSTLTVSTTAATTASLVPQSRGAFYAMWMPIVGLALLGTGFTSRKKKLLGFLLGCLLFSGLTFMAACGGSSSSGGGGGGGHPGTPAGAYTITVKGTGPSGGLVHTTNVTLTVQ